MTTTAQSPGSTASDDLATQILARRRKRLPAVTAILALAVVAGAAFIAGAEIQKHYGGGSSTSSATGAAAARAAAFGRFAGGTGGGNGRFFGGGGSGAFGGGAGGAATVGTVTLIKGSTLYVTDSTGNTVLVRTSASSRVTKTVRGTVQTIHPGDTVAVTGTQAANGSYTAAGIAITSGATNG